MRLLVHKEALLEQGRKIEWRPGFMRARYENWVQGLNQDWCVSRQRYAGVPFPVWYPLGADCAPDYASPIFATARPEVIDILTERFPALHRVGRSVLSRMICEQATPAPLSSGDCLSRLALLASRPLPEPDGCAEDGDVDPAIYVVPDMSPSHLFACLAESENAVETSADPHWRHTLIMGIYPQRAPVERPAAIGGINNS